MSVEFPDSDYIDFSDSESPANIFAGGGTICFWLNFASLGDNEQGRILEKNTDWRIDFRNAAAIETLRLLVIFSGNNSSHLFPNQSFDTFNIWQHVVIAYDSSDVANVPIFYLDGQSVAVTVNNTPTGTAKDDSGDAVRVGGRDTPDRDYDGKLADMRWYDRILTAKEAQTLFILKGQDFNLRGLEFWLRMKEKHAGQAVASGDVRDYSHNKYVSTTTGSPQYSEDLLSYECQGNVG